MATGAALTSVVAVCGAVQGPAAMAASGFPDDHTQVIGHRGGYDSPGTENSVRALREALRSGADAVEFDVRWTKDDKPVVMHDSTVNRTTNCSGTVEKMSYDSFRRCELNDGSQAPNIYEALMVVRDFPKAHAYVHVKGLYAKVQAKRMMHALNKYGLNNKNRSTVITTSRDQLWTAKKYGFEGRRGLLFGSSSGWSAGYDTLLPYDTSVTRDRVRKAQARGKEVVVVEGHPTGLSSVLGLELDGYMANNLQAALAKLSDALNEVTKRLADLD
ncbi:MAG: glycerophosphodiester phosphodiesterase [Sporichthyaceae bacterium]